MWFYWLLTKIIFLNIPLFKDYPVYNLRLNLYLSLFFQPHIFRPLNIYNSLCSFVHPGFFCALLLMDVAILVSSKSSLAGQNGINLFLVSLSKNNVQNIRALFWPPKIWICLAARSIVLVRNSDKTTTKKYYLFGVMQYGV